MGNFCWHVGIDDGIAMPEGTFLHIPERSVAPEQTRRRAVGTSMPAFRSNVDGELGQALLGEFWRWPNTGGQWVRVGPDTS
jgi:hypothetical protein